MGYFAVIDTNVVVSALIKAGTPPWKILQYAAHGIITPVLHEDIIGEYEEVLGRRKFGFPPEVAQGVIGGLKEHAVYAQRQTADEPFPDPDDAVFYETVLWERNRVGAYLITGNIKDYPERDFIVTPRQMLDIMANSAAEPGEGEMEDG